MKKLSPIGKGHHSEEYPVGFYTEGDRIKSWCGVGEAVLKADQYVLMIRSSKDDIARARSVLVRPRELEAA